MAHDIFISYSSRDKTTAFAACAKLESRQIRCWIGPRDVPPGTSYGESIVDAIAESRLFVLIFSDGANRSACVEREVERAVSKEIPILPFRIEEVTPTRSLEFFLSSRHWLDAMTPPLEQHLDYLADCAESILSATSSVEQPRSRSATRVELAHPPACVSNAPRSLWYSWTGWLTPIVVLSLILATGSYFLFYRDETNENPNKNGTPVVIQGGEHSSPSQPERGTLPGKPQLPSDGRAGNEHDVGIPGVDNVPYGNDAGDVEGVRSVLFDDELAGFGEVPDEWSRVGQLKDNHHEIARRVQPITADFTLKFSLSAARDSRGDMAIMLIGAKGGNDLRIAAVKTNTWSDNEDWVFQLPSGTTRKNLPIQPHTFILRREGDLFMLTADAVFRSSSTVIGQFAANDHDAFDEIRLSVSGPAISLKHATLVAHK